MWTKTFIYRIGGNYLVNGDETLLSKYDYVICNRKHYSHLYGDTWGTLRSLNPDIKIIIYQIGSEVSDFMDAYNLIDLNSLGRYNVSRDHSMGSVNGNHPEFFLLDSESNRIENSAYAQHWLMDFGSEDYSDYWLEGTINDIVNQVWVADGIYSDCIPTTRENAPYANPVKYPTNSSWSSAMNGYIERVASGLFNEGQLLGGNRGNTRTVDGALAWSNLDLPTTKLDFSLEEGTFAVSWGTGDMQVFGTTEWKRSLDVIKNTKHYKTFLQCHCDLASDGSGIDNVGNSFTFWDFLYFVLASFHLGAHSKSYFGLKYLSSYSQVFWFDEFEKIDLGDAQGDYTTEIISGVTIYKRAFSKGYVYVNPSSTNVATINLPCPCRNITHNNLSDQNNIIASSTLSLDAHRGAFLIFDATIIMRPGITSFYTS